MTLLGGDYPPYRSPCGGSVSCWMGPQFQQAKSTDYGKPVYVLSMQLPNWDGYPSGSPANITPYPKPAIVDISTCENIGCSEQSGGPMTSPPCGPWVSGAGGLTYTLVPGQLNTAPTESFTQPGSLATATVASGGTGYQVGDTLYPPGGVLTPDGIASSVQVTAISGGGSTGPITAVKIYQAGWYFTNPSGTVTPTGGTGTGASLNLTFTGATTSFAVCDKRGFKSVQARRYWHGRQGFDADSSEGCPNTISECDGNTVVYEAYRSSPPQTKYLVEARSDTFTYSLSNSSASTDPTTGDPITIDNTVSWSVTQTQTFSINPQSGVLTISSWVNTYGGTWSTSVSNGDNYSGQMLPPDSGDEAIHADFPSPYDGTLYATGAGTLVVAEQFSGLTFSLDACGGFVQGIPTWLEEAFGGTIYISSDLSTAIANYLAAYNEFIGPDGNDFGGSFSGSVSFSGDGFSMSVSGSIGGGPNIPNSADSWAESMSYSGSISLSSANTASSVYADAVSLLNYWDLTNDQQYPWRTDQCPQVSPLMARLEYGPNSPQQVTGLLSSVNDMRSPETDSSGNAPFTSGWSPTYAQMAPYDENAYQWHYPAGYDSSNSAADGLVLLYDGTIKGAPNAAGYVDYFQFDFLDWQACINSDGGLNVIDWYTFQYGTLLSSYISATGAQLPTNSTHWTNSYQSINKPPYAYAIYADPTQIGADIGGIEVQSGAEDATAIWLGKYAEIKESWVSQNFDRPGGDDKFAYIESAVYCLTNLAGSGPGSTWTLVDNAGNTPGSLTFSGDWGGKVVNGFYSGCTYAAGVVTLGTLAFNLPSNWASQSGDDDVCFGRLRWPTAPSLLGRAAVSVDGTGMNFTFGNGQPTFGMSAASTESIDVYDVSMNLLASAVTATRITDSTFTIPTSYTTSKFVMIHGSPAWYFCDQYQKGAFVTLQTVNDYRTNGEYARLTGALDCAGDQVSRPTQNYGYASFSQTSHCLGFHPCNPRVICFSPNGESFSNGLTIGFPSTFVFDERYGSRWQGVIQQIMDDPLWVLPHVPCGSGGMMGWSMADVCDENTETTNFYAHSPQVEAVLELPDDYGPTQSETPPDPFSLYGALAWIDPTTNPAGSGVYSPPGYVGYSGNGAPAPAVTSTSLHALFAAAVAPGSDCRFDYSDEVIV